MLDKIFNIIWCTILNTNLNGKTSKNNLYLFKSESKRTKQETKHIMIAARQDYTFDCVTRQWCINVNVSYILSADKWINQMDH